MLRVTVIFAFARSAMPVLHTLVRGASACLISPHGAMVPRRKQPGGLVVPIWVSRSHHATKESSVTDFAAARVKSLLTFRAKEASGLRDQTAAGEGDRDERAGSVRTAGKIGRAQVLLEAASPGIIERRDIRSEPAFAAAERRPVVRKIGKIHADHQ
jgi:hypothetical protein